MGLGSSLGAVGEAFGITTGRKQAKAYLADVLVPSPGDSNDDGSRDGRSIRAFQYFPETINDSRSVNYNVKEVIGGSHPIYQWVHGSERAISFEAVLTADYKREVQSSASSVLGGIQSVIKNPLAMVAGRESSASTDENAYDIAAMIAWLRSKTYPKYLKKKVQAPPVLLLYLPGSGITSYVGHYTAGVVPCLMRRCDVEYEAFFYDGTPRIARVSLEFSETIQIGSSWGFVDRGKVDSSWTTKYTNGSGDNFPDGGGPHEFSANDSAAAQLGFSGRV